MKGEESNFISDQSSLFEHNGKNCIKFEYFLQIGNNLLEQKQIEKALELFNEGLIIFPKSKELIYNKALILAELDKKEESLIFFDKTIELEPTAIEPYLEKAIVLMELNRDNEALIIYDEIIKIHKFSKEAFNGKGIIYAKNEENIKALQNFEIAIELDESFQEAYMNKAILLLKINELEKAISTCDLAIQFGKTSRDLYLLKADIFIKLGKLIDALKILDFTLNLCREPNENIEEIKCFIFIKKANILKNLKNFEEATLNFNNAIKINPNLKEIYFGKALICSELKLFEEADCLFDKAIQIDPFSKDTYFGKAIVLQEMKRYDEALITLDKILKFDEDLLKTYKNFKKENMKFESNKINVFKDNDRNIINQTYNYTYVGTEGGNEAQIVQSLGNIKKKNKIFPQKFSDNKNLVETKFTSENEKKSKNEVIDPFIFETLLEKAALLIKLNRLEESENCIETLSGLYLNNQEVINLRESLEKAKKDQIHIYHTIQNIVTLNENKEIEDIKVRDLYETAISYYKSEKFNEALKLIRKCIEIDKSNTIKYIFKEGIIYERMQDFEKALLSFEKILEIETTNILYYLKKAIILFHMNRYKILIDFLNAVISIDEYKILIIFNRGLIYFLNNDANKALSNLKRLLLVQNEVEEFFEFDKNFSFSFIRRIIYLIKNYIKFKNNIHLINTDENDFLSDNTLLEKLSQICKIFFYETNLKLMEKSSYLLCKDDNNEMNTSDDSNDCQKSNKLSKYLNEAEQEFEYLNQISTFGDVSQKENKFNMEKSFNESQQNVENIRSILQKKKETDINLLNESTSLSPIKKAIDFITSDNEKNINFDPKQINDSISTGKRIKFADTTIEAKSPNKDKTLPKSINKINLNDKERENITEKPNKFQGDKEKTLNFYCNLKKKKLGFDDINEINIIIKAQFKKISDKLTDIIHKYSSFNINERNNISMYLKGFNVSFYRCIFSSLLIEIEKFDYFFKNDENKAFLISLLITIYPFLKNFINRKSFFSVRNYFTQKDNLNPIYKINTLFKNIINACESIGKLCIKLCLDDRKLTEIMEIDEGFSKKLFEKDYEYVENVFNIIKEDLNLKGYMNYKINGKVSSPSFKLGEYDFIMIFRKFLENKFDILDNENLKEFDSEEIEKFEKKMERYHLRNLEGNEDNKDSDSKQGKRSCVCCLNF